MRSEYRITTEICTFFFGYFDSSFMHHGPSFLDNFPWQFSSGCFGFAYNVASIFVWFCRIWLLLLLDLIRFLRLNFLYILTIVDIRTIVFACVPLCGKRERERERIIDAICDVLCFSHSKWIRMFPIKIFVINICGYQWMRTYQLATQLNWNRDRNILQRKKIIAGHSQCRCEWVWNSILIICLISWWNKWAPPHRHIAYISSIIHANGPNNY